MERRLRVAVVGAGTWGRNHAIVYHEDPTVELVGICDISEERASNLAQEYGATPYTSLTQLLAQNLDCISVATPDHLHRDVVVQILECGVPVLVEKPLATTISDAEDIARAEKRTGTPVMVDFHARWHPNYVGAKKAIQSGSLGKVRTAYMRLHDRIEVPTSMLHWSAGSGPDWFLMAHTIDAISWLLDERPSTVFAKCSRGILDAKGVDAIDGFHAIMSFPSTSVVLDTNWVLPDGFPSLTDHRMTLVGERGSLDVSNNPTLGIAAANFTQPYSPVAYAGKELHFGPFYEPMRYFVRCVREGRRPEPTATDGVAVTRAIHAIRQSVASGKEEQIG